MLLKQIGAGIIALSIFGMMVATSVCGPGARCEEYGPFVMFCLMAVGAVIGTAGFITDAIERRKGKSDTSLSDSRLEKLLSAAFRELRRFRYRG
jgi:hypothetical protein